MLQSEWPIFFKISCASLLIDHLAHREQDETLDDEMDLPRLPASAFAQEDDLEDEAAVSDVDSEAQALMQAGSDDENDSVELNLLEDDDPDAPKQPSSINLLKARMSSATRALADWKNLGSQTSKSRSEIWEQFIADVCEYYGYNQFLAEKLLELFPIDEVSNHHK